MSSKARHFARLANRINVSYQIEDQRLVLDDVDFGANSSSDDIEELVTPLLKLTNLNDLTSTALTEQVLTANGDGTFFFANNAAREVNTLLDLSIVDGNDGAVLTTNGGGSFTFTMPPELTMSSLTDLNSMATANQVLTAKGDGTFFFANNSAKEVQNLMDLNITDGQNGQVLKTDGNGGFYFDDEDTLNSIIFAIALG